MHGELLYYTLVWVFGIQFALRAGQEHRNLRSKNSQLSLQHDESGNEFLQYMEDFRWIVPFAYEKESCSGI